MKDVPIGWVKTTLGEIAEWGSGGTPSRKIKEYYTGNIPWIKTGELKTKYIHNTEEEITQKALEKSSAKMFPTGSVAIAMYGATIGKTSILGIDASTNQACAIAKLNKKTLFNEFLYYYLVSIKNKLIEKGKGGAQPNISQIILKCFEISLPPIQEQHRIVSKIEELFSDLDNGIEQLKTAQQQLAVYRQAVLKWAFEGKLTKAWREENKPESAEKLLGQIQLEREKKYQEQIEEWEQKIQEWEAGGQSGRRPKKPKKLDQLKEVKCDLRWESTAFPNEWVHINFENVICNDLSNGKSAKNRDDGIPILKLNAIKNGIIDITEQKLGDLDKVTALKFYIQKNDFLISRGNGSIDLVGRAGLVIQDSIEIAFPDTMIRAEINSAICLHSYLKHLWNSPTLRSQVEEQAHTTAGIYKINQQHIKNFIIPLPTKSEQKSVIQEIENRLSVSEQIEKDISDAINRAEALRQSILKKAFEGKLVPQDPNDEPASELLKRIKAEKKSKTPKKIKSKKVS